MMNRSHICDPDPASIRWLVLGLVGVGTFMTTLDVSIVNVALPILTAAFKTDVGTSQWFVQIYLFVITVLLLLFGRLGDLVGRRRLYITGIFIFVAGSVVCGLSISALMLVLGRALQGVGASILMSSGPAMVTEGFPAADRGKALGFIGTAVAVGLLTGPVLGGIILEYATWHWMFFINVPVGFALVALMSARVSGFDTSRPETVDVPGATLMAVSLGALLIGLSYGEGLGWSSPASIIIFVFAAAAAAGFIAFERRRNHPLIDLSLFRIREFSIGAVAGWANYAAIMPVYVFIPFYLHGSLGLTPAVMGLTLASSPLTVAFVSPIAGHLSDRIGSRFLTSVGLLIAGIGLLLLRSLTPSSSWADVVWRLVFVGGGSAMFVSPNSSAILGSVPCERLGVASAVVALVRNLGMVCGVAIAGAVIAAVQTQVHVTGEIGADNPAIQPYKFLQGLKAAFLVSAIICFTASLISATRVRPGDREAFERMTRAD